MDTLKASGSGPGGQPCSERYQRPMRIRSSSAVSHRGGGMSPCGQGFPSSLPSENTALVPVGISHCYSLCPANEPVARDNAVG